MKRIALSPEFSFPDNRDYDLAIQEMNETVIEHGGAPYFLGGYRATRASHGSLRANVLAPLTRLAHTYDNAGLPMGHADANYDVVRAQLSGMLFGHIANEAFYPRITDTDPYYGPLSIYRPLMDNDTLLEFNDSIGKNQTISYRIGAHAMANLFLHDLSKESLEHISTWAHEMVGEPRMPLFVHGFGVALFSAWDAYSDMAVGRVQDELYAFPSMQAARAINSGEAA